jgi:hypothetical protein
MFGSGSRIPVGSDGLNKKRRSDYMICRTLAFKSLTYIKTQLKTGMRYKSLFPYRPKKTQSSNATHKFR